MAPVKFQMQSGKLKERSRRAVTAIAAPIFCRHKSRYQGYQYCRSVIFQEICLTVHFQVNSVPHNFIPHSPEPVPVRKFIPINCDAQPPETIFKHAPMNIYPDNFSLFHITILSWRMILLYHIFYLNNIVNSFRSSQFLHCQRTACVCVCRCCLQVHFL